ncbi:N-terminal nucleophile aminohydrolases superfamily protein [Prunus dulcis]|uniref:N-terminal nucleophile aminohydrolases superfamily protein n=1 Tax=Prunus dulcis TaxID=3755 RepID=A0A5H2XFH2_PRUDU|nr:N-terminal nucleophile aminohydrolases superfamily protein [Prunus dulcis]
MTGAIEVRGIHHRASHSFRTTKYGSDVENPLNPENLRICSDILLNIRNWSCDLFAGVVWLLVGF